MKTKLFIINLMLGVNLCAFGFSEIVNVVSQTTSATKTNSVTQTSPSQTSGLIDMLTQNLSISDKQASGGVGTILNYAQSNLSADKFQTLKSAIPNAQSLIDSAPQNDSTSNSLNSLVNSFGGDSSSAEMASLVSNFSSLGLSSDMIAKFIPIISQYFKSSDNSEAADILSSLF